MSESRELFLEYEEALASEPRERIAAEAAKLCDWLKPVNFLSARGLRFFSALSRSLLLSLSLLEDDSDELSSITLSNGLRKSGVEYVESRDR